MGGKVVARHDLGISVRVCQHEEVGERVQLAALVGQRGAASLRVVVVEEDYVGGSGVDGWGRGPLVE